MDIERAIRDLTQEVKNLKNEYAPVSKRDIEKRWVAVRETMDVFTKRLVEQELARQGHNDTLIKIMKQQQQLGQTLVNQSVQINEQQEQLNAIAVALEELRNGVHN